ncbi:MAG: serine--tRNA ligase, partial [Acidobacteriaceae bacterium]|nr:serine--tRNA ligase [Acidobacteriaceae bacterium]
MHDLSFFRRDLDRIRDRLLTRGFVLDVDEFKRLDAQRRQCVTETEQLKAERNQATVEIGKLRKAGEDTTERQGQVRAIGDRIAQLDEHVAKLDAEFRDFLARVPNIPNETVPIGRSEHDNQEVKRWGEPPKFSFPPQPHWELAAALNILDLERAAKITGARFAVYWALGARLERALINFMLDLHTREHGYQEISPPVLVRDAAMFGTAQLPKFFADQFLVSDGAREEQREHSQLANAWQG